MSVIASVARKARAFVWRAFGGGDDDFRLGVYGAPNAGKTALSNRICLDWEVELMGSVSEVPHETRGVERRTIVLRSGRESLTIEVMDTPGIASYVSTIELEALWNIPASVARARAKAAADGILLAIRNLERIDGLVLVVDGTQDPRTQVSETLAAHVRGRNLPHVVVANKMDLVDFDDAAVRRAFPRSPVVSVSALRGTNMTCFYDELMRVFG